MSVPKPVGTVAPYELIGFCEELASARFTGVLRLRDRGEIRIYFVEGGARYCIGSALPHSFAAQVLRFGLFSRAQLKPMLAAANQANKRLEEHLVDAEVLGRAEVTKLQVALSDYVFGDACTRGPAPYRLERGNPPAVIAELSLDPMGAWAKWAARWDTHDHAAELAKAGVPAKGEERPLEKGPRWASATAAFEAAFGEEFTAVARRIEAGPRASELGDDAARLIFGLTRCEALAFGTASGGLELTLEEALGDEGLPDVDFAPAPVLDTPIEVNTKVPGGAGLASALADAVAMAAQHEKARDEGVPVPPKRSVSAPGASPAGAGAKDPLDLAHRIPPIDPERQPPQEPDLRAVYDFRQKLPMLSHFEVLGLPPGASLSSIHAARGVLAARFDPRKWEGGWLPADSREDLEWIEKALDSIVADLAEERTRVRIERKSDGMSALETRRYFEAHEHYRKGRDLIDEGRHEEAVATLNKAVEFNARDAWYHLWLGNAVKEHLVASGAWAASKRREVERHYRDALVLDLHFERARLTLARLCRECGDRAGALEHFRAALEANPQCADARQALKDLTGEAVLDQSGGVGGLAEGLKGKVGGLLGRFKKER